MCVDCPIGKRKDMLEHRWLTMRQGAGPKYGPLSAPIRNWQPSNQSRNQGRQGRPWFNRQNRPQTPNDDTAEKVNILWESFGMEEQCDEMEMVQDFYQTN